MHNELTVAPGCYQNSFPSFGQPKIIGFLSLNGQRLYQADTSQLKFAKEVIDQEVYYDLNLKLNEVKRRTDNTDEKIDHLLQFLLDQEQRLNFPLAKTLESAHFFCYRGLLTCVACTPFENQEAWRIVATLYKGKIYLCALYTEDKIERLRNTTDKDKQFTSWGYKFEQFMLSDSLHTKPNPNLPVDEGEEFSLIFSTNLNNHTIIYGAEMDGINCDKKKIDTPPDTNLGVEAAIQYLSTKEFIELKTCRHLEFSKQLNNFRRYKTRKWWCQSYLAGIETLLCGFRNDDGVVQQLKVYNVKDLATMSGRFWTPNVCFNFLNTFLTYVKRCLEKEIIMKYGEEKLKDLQNLPLVSLHFEWAPRMPVRVTNNYNYDADPILPDWFVKM